VGDRVFPDASVTVAVALPLPFVTVTETGYEPAAGAVPETTPELEPSVRPVAEKVSGAWPVAGIADRNGGGGSGPTTAGSWIRGVAGAAAMEMAIVVWARAALHDARAAPAMAAATTDARVGVDIWVSL